MTTALVKPTIVTMATAGGSPGLNRAREKMVAEGVDPVAIDTFAHYYRLLEHGETGMIAESTIEPVEPVSLRDVRVDDEVGAQALRSTAVINFSSPFSRR